MTSSNVKALHLRSSPDEPMSLDNLDQSQDRSKRVRYDSVPQSSDDSPFSSLSVSPLPPCSTPIAVRAPLAQVQLRSRNDSGSSSSASASVSVESVSDHAGDSVDENAAKSRQSFTDYADKFFESTHGGLKCRNTSCKSSGKVFTTLKLSNLKKHVKTCNREAYEKYEDSRKFVNMATGAEKNLMRKYTVVFCYEFLIACCVELCTANGCSLSMVNYSGFQRLLSPMLQALKTEGSSSISSSLIRDEIIKAARTLRASIRDRLLSKALSLKIDCATRHITSYLGINAQFVEHGKIVVQLLKVMPILVEHTALNLKEAVLRAMAEYGILIDQVVSLTTDNGANVLKVSRLLNELSFQTAAEPVEERDSDPDTDGQNDDDEDDEEEEGEEDESEAYSHTQTRMHELAVRQMEDAAVEVGVMTIRCAAHTLQLAINDTVTSPEIGSMLEKVRCMVKKLRSQNVANLMQRLKLKRAILDNKTRWTSGFKMIDRFLELQAFIQNDVPDVATELDDEEWENLADLRDSLKPSVDATIALQKETLPFSETLPIFLRCIASTERVRNRFGDKMVDSMKKRTDKIFTPDLFAAVILDRRYKSLLDANQIKLGKARLLTAWEKELIRSGGNDENTPITTSDGDQGDDDILGEIMNKNEAELQCFKAKPSRSKDTMKPKIDDFIRLPRLDVKRDILAYWESEKLLRPELYQLAMTFLCIPATQVSVERLFSNLKFVKNDHRQNLANDFLEDILLLRMEKKKPGPGKK